MSEYKTTRATKGQVKCFECRNVIRTKDGTWQEISHRQVFLCTGCNRVHGLRSGAIPAPAFAVNRGL